MLLLRTAVRRLLLLVLWVLVASGVVIAGLAGARPGASFAQGRLSGEARPLVIVAVFDGLRPDMISADVTPTLDRLRREGVAYTASHAAFPTVTRVNAPTLSTGTWPERHGLVSNTMFVPAVDAARPFSTGEWSALVKLRDASGGRLLFTKTLAEIVQERGLTFVAVSSGSTGSGFLLNPKAPEGVGVLINAGLDPGRRAAFPDRVNEAILQAFGAKLPHDPPTSVDWAERVLREYVLTELRPHVLFTWLTEPDGAQHEHGVNSPQARAALRNSDRNLGLLIDALAARKTPANVFITSDHGFARHDRAVNLTQGLVRAGLKVSPTSDDVMVVSNGQSVLFHVKGKDEAVIRRLVTFLQAHEAVDVIFTPASRTGAASTARSAAASAGAASSRYRGPVQGWVPGTFALELAHAANEARAADVVCSLAWSAAPNGFGVVGSQTIVSDSREGTLEGEGAGHGGLNPWTVRNTLLLWGPSFKRGVSLDTPAAIVDIAPTVVALLGIEPGVTFDGRVLDEAFAARAGATPASPAPAKATNATTAPWKETVTVEQGDYEAEIRLSGVDDRWYVDEGRRVRRAAVANVTVPR